METQGISHADRLRICLSGETPDRPPVALWRHFPVDDQRADSLAGAVLDFQRQYDFDLVKVTPASSFCVRDWGVEDEWRGNPEGTRDFTRPAIQSPRDWERLAVLDPSRGSLGAQLECLRLLAKELDPQATPFIQTIFNPLSQAKNLVGKQRLVAHLRQYPEAVHAGLRTITETTRRFIEAALETGIAGVFYAIQHAQHSLLTVDEYLEFGRAYDLQTLEPAAGLWLNLLHLHGEDVMFSEVLGRTGPGRGGHPLPVSIVNWHDRETPPALLEAQQLFSGTVCGGLRQLDTMLLGDPAAVAAEAADAIQATGGKRFILGTGCVLFTTTPRGNILAARRSVDAVR